MNAKMMAPLIRLLREETGSSIMDCKKALIACNMNIDKAVKWLKYNTSPVVIMDHPIKQIYDPEKDIVILEKEDKQMIDGINNFEPMTDCRNYVKWPMSIKDATDVMFSHNESINLWYESPTDGYVSIWLGNAWACPDEYKDLLILKVFGTIADTIWRSNIINLIVNADDTTPRNIPRKEHDISNCSDAVPEKSQTNVPVISVNKTYSLDAEKIEKVVKTEDNNYLVKTNDGNYYLDTPFGIFSNCIIDDICIDIFNKKE